MTPNSSVLKKSRGTATLGCALLLVVLAALGAGPAALAGDEEVRLEVILTAEETGNPIANASVYLKYQEKRFLRKDKKVEFSGKTDQEGKAVFPPVPEGRVLVQIVAKGWKTYGKFHEIEGPKQTLEVKLQPVKRWY